MQKYTVKVTYQATEQLQGHVSYLSSHLGNAAAARNLMKHIKSAINRLRIMPERYTLVDEEPWHTDGVRKLTVRGYILYYYVDKSSLTVYVTGIVYGRMNQLEQLKQMFF